MFINGWNHIYLGPKLAYTQLNHTDTGTGCNFITFTFSFYIHVHNSKMSMVPTNFIALARINVQNWGFFGKKKKIHMQNGLIRIFFILVVLTLDMIYFEREICLSIYRSIQPTLATYFCYPSFTMEINTEGIFLPTLWSLTRKIIHCFFFFFFFRRTISFW